MHDRPTVFHFGKGQPYCLIPLRRLVLDLREFGMRLLRARRSVLHDSDSIVKEELLSLCVNESSAKIKVFFKKVPRETVSTLLDIRAGEPGCGPKALETSLRGHTDDALDNALVRLKIGNCLGDCRDLHRQHLRQGEMGKNKPLSSSRSSCANVAQRAISAFSEGASFFNRSTIIGICLLDNPCNASSSPMLVDSKTRI